MKFSREIRVKASVADMVWLLVFCLKLVAFFFVVGILSHYIFDLNRRLMLIGIVSVLALAYLVERKDWACTLGYLFLLSFFTGLAGTIASVLIEIDSQGVPVRSIPAYAHTWFIGHPGHIGLYAGYLLAALVLLVDRTPGQRPAG